MDIQVIDASDMNLSEVQFRYYCVINPGVIIKRGNLYRYYEEIGTQELGFRGIDAEFRLTTRQNADCYEKDIFAYNPPNIYKRYTTIYYKFESGFAIFKDNILKSKRLFNENCLEYYKIEVLYNGTNINMNPKHVRIPENRAKIEYEWAKQTWENVPEAKVILIKLDEARTKNTKTKELSELSLSETSLPSEFKVWGYGMIERTSKLISSKGTMNRVYVPKDWTDVIIIKRNK